MRITSQIKKPRSEWERLIDEWILNDEHREILKTYLLDGGTYETVSEEFGCSKDKVAQLIPKLQNFLLTQIQK